jgi:hypothetical protein
MPCQAASLAAAIRALACYGILAAFTQAAGSFGWAALAVSVAGCAMIG